MNWPRCVRCLVLSAIGVTALPAQAADFQIYYAEPITLQAADVAGTATTASSQSPRLVSFQAYGRQFDLELEPNTRLLSGLAPGRRRALSRYELLRGKVAGLHGSWVRLTRVGNELNGAIWDGSDFYVVSPARKAARFMIGPLAARGAATVVYRLSDVESGLGPQFCGVGKTKETATGLVHYQALIAELRSNTALTSVPGNQIEIALVADFELFAKYGQATEPSMLSNMNIVDGIYSEQVGVKILIPQFQVFTTDTDPFTTNVAENLLNELASYRENTPAIRNPGLAHLFTGRRLSGETAGIAYLDSLCEPFFGVSLTDDSFGNANSPLIAAHEIGHNFGAPHDDEAGSPCASQPPFFLMSPTLNGSSQFSQCSLDQMRPRIAAAACVTRSNLGDAAASMPVTVTGLTGEIITIPVDIESVGTASVRDVAVTVTGFPGQTLSATVPGGSCSFSNGNVDCQLGSLDSGASRRIEIGTRVMERITSQANMRLTASNDFDPDNNFASAQVVVTPAADVQVSITPGPINALTRRLVTLSATVAALGPQPSTEVVATVRGTGLTLDSATSDGGSCTLGFNDVTCAYGTMAVGASHRIDLTYSGTSAGNFAAVANSTSTNDGDRFNNVAATAVVLAPLRDVTVRTDTPFITVAVNRPFTFSANVISAGPESVSDVMAFLSVPLQVTVDSLTAEGGICSLQPIRQCAFGSLPPGASRRIDVQAHAAELAGSSGGFSVQAPDDDDFRNNSADMQFNVRQASDVSIHPFESRAGLETRPFFFGSVFRSVGVETAADVTLTVELPPTLTVVSAFILNGSCTVSSRTATCVLPTMAAGSQATMQTEIRGDQVGRFTATVRGTAANDADATNNSQALTIDINPFIDLGLTLPVQTIAADPGETFTFPVTVTTGPQPVPDARLLVSLDTYYQLAVASLTTSSGSCSVQNVMITCLLGTLPARSTAEVNIGLRTLFKGTASIPVEARAPGDGNFDNDRGSVSAVIADRGDVTVNLAATSRTVMVGDTFDLPAVTIATDQPVDEVYVDLLFQGGDITIESLAGVSICPSGSYTNCYLGTVTPGSAPMLTLRLRGLDAGTTTVTAVVRSQFDTNPQNNQKVITLQVNAAPPPPPDSGGGGGGGGGCLGLTTLAALLLLLASRRIRQDALHGANALHQ